MTRLVTVNTIQVTGYADRAPNVSAQLKRRHSGCKSGGSAARGPSTSSCYIPGIIGSPVDIIEALKIATRHGGIRFT